MTEETLDLIRRIQNGDDTAEAELYANYREKIKAIVLKRLNIRNAGWEDVCSEILTAILVRLRDGSYDPQKGPLSSYIYGIALNKIKTFYKSERIYRELIAAHASKFPHESHDDSLALEEKERRENLKIAVSSLKRKYKEVIYLRYYEGKSIAEIAQQLDLEPRRVSERIHYAISVIQKKVIKD